MPELKNQSATPAAESPQSQITEAAAAATGLFGRLWAFLNNLPRREKPLPGLHGARIKSAEYERNVWLVTPDAGTHPLELLAPDYWAHVAFNLKQRDVIHAWAEDLAWYGEYLVLEAGPNWAKVHLRESTVELFARFDATRAAGYHPAYDITYKGLFAKWCVVRKKDSMVVKDKCVTEGDALSWLSEHVKSMAA